MVWRLLTSGFGHWIVLAFSVTIIAVTNHQTIRSRIQSCGWGILIGVPVLLALFELFPLDPIVDASGEIRIKIYLIAIVAVVAGMVAIVWNDW